MWHLGTLKSEFMAARTSADLLISSGSLEPLLPVSSNSRPLPLYVSNWKVEGGKRRGKGEQRDWLGSSLEELVLGEGTHPSYRTARQNRNVRAEAQGPQVNITCGSSPGQAKSQDTVFYLQITVPSL